LSKSAFFAVTQTCMLCVVTCDQLSDYQCNDNVYYMSNNLEDLDYRDDSILIRPSPAEFNLRALLPGRL